MRTPWEWAFSSKEAVGGETVGHNGEAEADLEAGVGRLQPGNHLVAPVNAFSVCQGGALDVKVDPLQPVHVNDSLVGGQQLVLVPARHPDLLSGRPSKADNHVAPNFAESVDLVHEVLILERIVSAPGRAAPTVTHDERQGEVLVSGGLVGVHQAEYGPERRVDVGCKDPGGDGGSHIAAVHMLRAALPHGPPLRGGGTEQRHRERHQGDNGSLHPGWYAWFQCITSSCH